MKKNNKTSHSKITSRAALVERVKGELERRGYPRLQMFLVVCLTGGAGFLASYGLLHAGLASLALRYGLAVVIAYGVFLLLLWLWLRTDANTYEGFDEAVGDILEAIPQGGTPHAHIYRGAGGEFGGAGANGTWDAGSAPEPLVQFPDIPLPSANVADVADADELAIPLAVVIAVAALVFTLLLAAASVVYSAPILFAELLVDGVLCATLYRRLRRLDPRHWLQSAVRRTIVPFSITAVLAITGGWALTLYAPHAHTLAEALLR
jgi:hypothetical protein